MLAAYYGLLGEVDKEIGVGSDVNATAGDKNMTALMIAAREGRGQIVGRLLEAGADSRIVSQEGLTAQDLAQETVRGLQKSYEDIGVLIHDGEERVDGEDIGVVKNKHEAWLSDSRRALEALTL